jgi:DNA-binding XRE family transcriptional regulator
MEFYVNRERLGGSIDELREELRAEPDYRLARRLHDMAVMIGRRVASMRTEADLTQAKLADRLGVDQSLIARLEAKNPTRVPTLYTIARVADACGYDVDLVFRPKASAAHAERAQHVY